MSGFTEAELAAIARLSNYNSGVFNAATNATGMAGIGYKTNLTPAFNDAALAASAIGRVAAEANAVIAALAAVQDGPVISINGQGGLVELDAEDIGAVATVNGQAGPNVILTAANVGAVATVNGKDGPDVDLTAADVGAVSSAAPTLANDRYPVVDHGTVASGTVTFHYSAGSVQRLQVGGPLTIAIDSWPPAGNKAVLNLEIVNGGSAVVSFPAGIKWLKTDNTGGFTTTNPYTLQAAGIDTVWLWTWDAGANIYGRVMR